jgi:hypothetical protein
MWNFMYITYIVIKCLVSKNAVKLLSSTDCALLSDFSHHISVSICVYCGNIRLIPAINNVASRLLSYLNC